MPHFVTDILATDRAASGIAAPRASWLASASDARAYRLRMATLRTRASDTLRARVRRELRAAAQRSPRTE